MIIEKCCNKQEVGSIYKNNGVIGYGKDYRGSYIVVKCLSCGEWIKVWNENAKNRSY